MLHKLGCVSRAVLVIWCSSLIQNEVAGWPCFSKMGMRRCFYFTEEVGTAKQGIARCASFGDHIATLDNPDLTNDMRQNLLALRFWLGVFFKNNKWTAWDGSPLAWTKWKTGEPNGAPSPANCAIYTVPDGYGDNRCDNPLVAFQVPSLCEVMRENVGNVGAMYTRRTGSCINGEEIYTDLVQSVVHCAALCEANEVCSSIAIKDHKCVLLKRIGVNKCFDQHDIYIWA